MEDNIKEVIREANIYMDNITRYVSENNFKWIWVNIEALDKTYPLLHNDLDTLSRYNKTITMLGKYIKHVDYLINVFLDDNDIDNTNGFISGINGVIALVCPVKKEEYEMIFKYKKIIHGYKLLFDMSYNLKIENYKKVMEIYEYLRKSYIMDIDTDLKTRCMHIVMELNNLEKLYLNEGLRLNNVGCYKEAIKCFDTAQSIQINGDATKYPKLRVQSNRALRRKELKIEEKKINL